MTKFLKDTFNAVTFRATKITLGGTVGVFLLAMILADVVSGGEARQTQISVTPPSISLTR
jgi:hypothetical protein